MNKRTKSKLILLIIINMITLACIITLSKGDINNNSNSDSIEHNWDWEYSGDTGDVLSVAISGDGNYSVVGTRSNRVYLFNKTSMIPVWEYETNGSVNDIAFAKNGTTFIVGCGNNNLFCFNISSSNPLWTFNTLGPILSVGISDKGSYSIAGSADDNLYFFNNSPGFKIPLWTYNSSGDVNSVAISSNGEYVVAGTENNQTIFLNKTLSALKKPIWNFTANGAIKSTALSSNGSIIISGSEDQYIYVFNKSSSILKVPIWKYDCNGTINSLATNDTFISAGCENNLILFFNHTKPYHIFNYTADSSVRTVKLTHNAQNIIAGTSSGRCYILRGFNKSSRLLNSFFYDGNSINSIDASSSKNIFVVGKSNHLVYKVNYTEELLLISNLLAGNSIRNFKMTPNAKNFFITRGNKVYFRDGFKLIAKSKTQGGQK